MQGLFTLTVFRFCVGSRMTPAKKAVGQVKCLNRQIIVPRAIVYKYCGHFVFYFTGSGADRMSKKPNTNATPRRKKC